MVLLVLPNAFSPTLCAGLVSLHSASPTRQTGQMREVDGKTVEVLDPAVKRRRDLFLHPDDMAARPIWSAVCRNILPAANPAFGLEITRLERHLVGLYDAEEGGHFGLHRDDTLPGTRHRKVALSVLLNDDYEGGELELPEVGAVLKPRAGTAVLFGCSQLHRVRPVTAGRRYAYVSFLYDEDGEAVRLRDMHHIGETAP